jgi:hypothetical protein
MRAAKKLRATGIKNHHLQPRCSKILQITLTMCAYSKTFDEKTRLFDKYWEPYFGHNQSFKRMAHFFVEMPI